MRLSTRGRYAVIAMSDLAQRTENHHPTPLSEIARRQQISLNYLEQLFVQLRRAGLVSAKPGREGGYFLAQKPEQIRIADIIISVDEPIKMTKCSPGQKLGCTGKTTRCQTHQLWLGLAQQIMAYLSKIHLSDVARGEIPIDIK